MHELVNGWYKGRAAIKKPLQGAFFDNDRKPKAACYIGAMFYGLIGQTAQKPVALLVADGYTVLRHWTEPPCDCDSDNTGTIAGILIHLNDYHDRRQWSEQKITDWLTKLLEKSP